MQTEKAGKIVTQVYILLMFIGFPIFYTDKLFHITDDKKQFFLFVTAVYAGILVLLKAFEVAKGNDNDRQKHWQAETVFCIIFILSILWSTCLAPDKTEAFYGISERRLGVLVMVGCIFAYLGVRRYGKFQNLTMGSILLGSGWIYLCGILCACKINFLHLQDDLMNPEIFLTPIGNTNFNTSYLCLMLPVVMVMFLVCEEGFFRMLHGMVLFLGLLFSFFIKTESSIICIWAVLFLLAYVALEKKLWFERYLQILLLYGIASVTIFLLIRYIPFHLFPFDGMGQFLLSGKIICAEIVLGILFGGLYCWKKDELRKVLLKNRKTVRKGVCLLVVAGSIVFIAVNSIFYNSVDGTLWENFKVVDATFHGRGYIWIRTVRRFLEVPWKNRIFGSGLNSFLRFIGAEYREEMREIYALVYVDPHNLFLQMLVTMGIVGVIGFFGLLFAVLYRAVRMYQKNEMQIAVMVTIAVYLLQGMVNSATIHTFPLVFVILGLASGDMRQLSEQGT